MSPETSLGTRIAAAEAAVAAAPHSAMRYFHLGTLLYRAGQLQAATDALRTAVELDEKLARAWVNLGGVLFARWDFTASLHANERAALAMPDAPQPLFNAGLCHLYLGNAAEVVACFRLVIKLDPSNGAAHHHLAAGLNAMGEKEAANTALERAARLGFSPDPALLKDIEKALAKTNQTASAFTVEIDGPEKDHLSGPPANFASRKAGDKNDNPNPEDVN
jgi:tetratricopeptide (TPR) repeat protein